MKRQIATAVLASLAVLPRAEAAEPAACQSPRFSDVGWTDISVTTAMSAMVLEALGYSPKLQILSVAVTFESLKQGDTDIFLGNWMPLQEPIQKPLVEAGQIEVVRPNLEGALIGFAVPEYSHQAGLQTYADIAKFKDQLGGKIYSIEAGSSANTTILKAIAENAFDLGDFELVESSEQGMLAQVQRAIQAEQPILFFGWRPHPMNVRYELAYLTDGNDTFGPDDGAATVLTNTRAGLSGECPNLGKFLSNLAFTVEAEDMMMSYVLDDGLEPKAAAERWLKDNPAALDGWLADVTTVAGEPGLPAAKAALGL
ncbi:glycine betaine/proline transport system substrate-binding protein [Paracoccus aminovorans]|uniref:Glycine betaine/proline transport system substrate-binding protein n=1 Tax=Paracoccus aminovorans TaxID=34004 RepID=A0A1I3AE45_9RHOB|nr:choline ABC transporter substrate-binding protein [Paracoccus aminovorans]CQR84200.1 glycine/betaine ABC transporter substrate-binding protein [Paracoccus aminovorans]SFH47989.1 glycine betaine/proline transport system substrate-binding protein [Paracoccus aminovorans]